MARYLSRADLSHIAGKYIDQYYTRFGISKDDPEPIDPERLASSVLGLNVKMLPLCSDGSILGLTVFQKCGFTVTLVGSTFTLSVRVMLTAKQNYDDVETLLNRIVPENLILDLSLMYNQHQTLAAFTHAQLAAYTHYFLRNEVLPHGNN